MQFQSFSLQPWNIASTIDFNELILDSRNIQRNDCFIAINGHDLDGRQFIAKAISQGASAVLQDADLESSHGTIVYIADVPVISFYGLNSQLSALAAQLYQQPSQQLQMVGVTGTNGKSTITQIIANWVDLLGEKAGVMGTIGNGLFGDLTDTENTTGSALDVQAEINRQLSAGAKLSAMEVSSHGLLQGRVNAVDFDVALFTNLTRDHLDYHGSMENYAAAKKQLFIGTAKHKIINHDDACGANWLTEFDDAIAFSVCDDLSVSAGKYIFASELQFGTDGFQCQINSSWGQGLLRSQLIGEFNVSNVTAALASLLALGYDLTTLLEVAPLLTPVCGRMELFNHANSAAFVVDYAHTPDALEQALKALRVHCTGQLWCIYGCGGDRDKGKRPLMAKVAEKFADKTIITDDNPRTEPADLIVNDMLAGLTDMDLDVEQAVVIHDRQAAIAFALKQSNSNDVVLVAGKGHENYQIIGKEKLHYSDRESIQTLLASLS